MQLPGGIQIKRPFFSILILLSLGCGTQQVNLRPHINNDRDVEYVFVSSVDHDDHGLPLFHSVLEERPDRLGGTFTLGLFRNGRPEQSFDILISDQRDADLSKPLHVIYNWTGKGFVYGASVTGNMLQNPVSISSDEEALVYLAVAVAPTVVGTAGGFVVGVAASIPDVYEELKCMMLRKKETLVSYTSYGYDDMGRLVRAMMYTPTDPPELLAVTDFHYSGRNTVPDRTEVISYPEQKTRTIQ